MRQLTCLLCLGLAVAAAPARPAPRPRPVSIVDLGAGFAPADLNQAGTVVMNQANDAYTWIRGKTKILPRPPASVGAMAQNVSATGLITGTANLAVAVWRNRRPQILQGGNVGLPRVSRPNRRGFFAGWAVVPNESPVAESFSHYPYTVFGYVGYGRFRAQAVNDSRVVAGYTRHFALEDDVPVHAASVYRRNQVETLFPYVSPTRSEAVDLNNLGQVVGNTWVPASNQGRIYGPPFRWQNGQVTTLPVLPEALESEVRRINKRGDVVGTVLLAGGSRAVRWQGAVVSDLNTLLPAGTGWVLREATSINDRGWIVGVGELNGAPHGFLLKP